MKLPQTFPHHFAFVVHDLNASMVSYERLFGVGPWSRSEYKAAAVFRGQKVQHHVSVAVTRWGPSFLELVYPHNDECLPGWLLKNRGAGLYHLGWPSDDLAGTHVGPFAATTVGESPQSGERNMIFLDTVSELGFYAQLHDLETIAGMEKAHRDVAVLLAKG